MTGRIIARANAPIARTGATIAATTGGIIARIGAMTGAGPTIGAWWATGTMAAAMTIVPAGATSSAGIRAGGRTGAMTGTAIATAMATSTVWAATTRRVAGTMA